MNADVRFTKRQAEIAELLAWGASKKEVAEHLCISERTVENHTKDIYEATGCGKVNELSAWWFCTRFHISFKLSPLARKVSASILLIMFSYGAYTDMGEFVREINVRSSRMVFNTPRVRVRESNSFQLKIA